MVVALSIAAVGAFVVSRDMEDLRDDFIAACRMHALSDEQIADELQIGRGQFADQKALRNHLSLWRIKNLSLGLQRTFWRIHGKRLGLTVVEDSRLGELIEAALFFLNWFKQRRVAKMARVA
jgi:hypothetical protein